MAKAKGPSARRPRPPVMKVDSDIHDDDQRMQLLERLQALREYKIEYEGWAECPHCDSAGPVDLGPECPDEAYGSGI